MVEPTVNRAVDRHQIRHRAGGKKGYSQESISAADVTAYT